MYLKLNVYSENNIFSKIFSQISIFFAKLNIWCKYCYFGNQRDFSAVKFINELMCDTLFSNNKNAFNEPRSNLDFWRKFRFRFLKLSIFDQNFSQVFAGSILCTTSHQASQARRGRGATYAGLSIFLIFFVIIFSIIIIFWRPS